MINFLEYLIDEQDYVISLVFSSQRVFIKKKEIISNEHFSNPTLDEEMRVWHYEKNLQRRQVCFDMADERNVQPIQIALAFMYCTNQI